MKKVNIPPKSRYKAEDLYDWCLTEVSINCSNCVASDSIMHSDEYDGAIDFFEKGWRATKSGQSYCPKCAAKKLKNP